MLEVERNPDWFIPDNAKNRYLSKKRLIEIPDKMCLYADHGVLKNMIQNGVNAVIIFSLFPHSPP